MRLFPWLLVTFCWPCVGEVSSSISLSNGVHLMIETTFGTPTGQQVIKAAMAPATGNSFYRIFRDQNGLAVYAYELQVERSSGGDEFRLTARPAGNSFMHRFPDADGGKPTPTLSALRELPVMHSGDRVPFPVFAMEGSGLSVVDTIELKLDGGPAGGRGAESFRFAGLKVYSNRVLASAPAQAVVS